MATRRLAPALAVLLSAGACADHPSPADPNSSDTTSTSDDSSATDTSTDTTAPSVEEPAPALIWPTLSCDPLVPEHCALPFPNNVYTADDPASPTGRRLALSSAGLPVHESGYVLDPASFNRADGFSPGQAPMAYLPGASATGLPTWVDIEASLAADAPTVLLDAETGERVAHFAEIDISHANFGPLMIRPAQRLLPGRRYIVALRGVVDESGAAIEPSPSFRTLRDLLPTDDPELEARRPLYADIFARLTQAGVERETLQLAWDYTTASDAYLTTDLLSMRDQALALYAEDEGPSYTIDTVDVDFKPWAVAYRLEGTLEVPLFLDDPGAGGRIVRGPDGLPEIQGTTNYKWIVTIPQSALVQPGGILQFGHGLLDNADQVQFTKNVDFANQHNYVQLAMNWVGMSDQDVLHIINMLASGHVDDFGEVSGRLQQGILNFELGMRMMRTSFAADPVYGQYVDPSVRLYHGVSQGGIFGATYMSISTEVERGVLNVPGQPFNLLLNRSVQFDPFMALLHTGYDDARDLQVILALAQMHWDHADPISYAHHLANDPLPGTPAHQVLVRAVLGDHQVTTIGAQIMARAIGAAHLDTGVREVWGLDSVSGSNPGSTYVEFDFGLPMEPLGNVPMSACEDPHGKLSGLGAAQEQAALFFATGVVENTCALGLCSYPALSGCP